VITAIGNPVFDLIKTPKVDTQERILSGCSTNAVLALNKLGEATRLVGAIGPDFRGQFETDFATRGIESVIIDSESSGGFSLHYYDDFGNRTLDLLDKASDITNIKPEWYTDSKAVLIGPILGEVSFAEIKKIRENFDGLFFCDPQGLLRGVDADGRINHTAPEGIREALSAFDVVKPNELEGQVLTGLDCRKHAHETAKIIHSWGPKIVFLTLAELGAVIYDGSECVDIPPDEIRQPADIPAVEVNLIDSTGAGDTSMAGFTFEYLRTKDIVKSACFAGATSSIMIENVGPDFTMTEDMVRERAEKLYAKIQSGWRLEKVGA
jgi:fructokinase